MIRLVRDLNISRQQDYDNIYFLFAEGFGYIPEAMGQLAALRWYQAGRPSNTLFVTSGKKICHPTLVRVRALSNTSCQKEVALPYTLETGILLDSLIANGVPRNQCLFISDDDNTYQQATILRREILENDEVCQLSCCWSEIPIVGITHSLHEQRCSGTFRKCGYNLQAMLTVPYHPDKRQPLSLPHMRHEWLYRLMEPVRIWQYRRKGWM